MALVPYLVHDDEGYDSEEQGWSLIAAHNPRQACNIWRTQFGADEGCVPVAGRPEWRWPGKPAPVPTVAGPWYPDGFRGFGIWMEDDVTCEGCDEHVDPDDFRADEGLCVDCLSAGVRWGPDGTRFTVTAVIVDSNGRVKALGEAFDPVVGDRMVEVGAQDPGTPPIDPEPTP